MKKIKKYRTDFLFPTPSFLIGAGSVFNIAGNYFNFNYSSSDKEADNKAIMSDWGVIGQDISSAETQLNEILTLEKTK
jgi:hypothetical protein